MSELEEYPQDYIQGMLVAAKPIAEGMIHSDREELARFVAELYQTDIEKLRAELSQTINRSESIAALRVANRLQAAKMMVRLAIGEFRRILEEVQDPQSCYRQHVKDPNRLDASDMQALYMVAADAASDKIRCRWSGNERFAWKSTDHNKTFRQRFATEEEASFVAALVGRIADSISWDFLPGVVPPIREVDSRFEVIIPADTMYNLVNDAHFACVKHAVADKKYARGG